MNDWMKLVMKIKNETGKSLKEAMKAAKKVYKKGVNVIVKKTRKTRKSKKTKKRTTRKARKGKSKRRRR